MKTLIASALALVVLFGSAVSVSEAPNEAPKGASITATENAEILRTQKPAYPLTKCVASGRELDAKAIDVVYDGRLVRLCSGDCKATAEKDKAAWIAKIDAAVIAAQKPTYPLATCPISGEKLGAKGEPIDVVSGTKLVRLCCTGCVPAYEKDVAAAMAKVDKAWIDAQVATYPLDTCVVSDEKLDSMGGAVDVLYGTKLIRLCCKGCKKSVEKEGPALVAKIEAARKN